MTTQVAGSRKRLYVIVAVFLALWAAVLTALSMTVIPDTYWYSYYAIDYTLGFVRRGLAGELVTFIPGDNIFFEQKVGRWVSSGAFILALGLLSWWIAIRSGRSERRLQLALLVVVLPFGFAFGLLQAGSTLFGGAAMIGLAIAVAAARSDRWVIIACALYGAASVVLTLIHEAIPFLSALGVIAIMVVLGEDSPRQTRLAGLALALGPGLATALVVAVFGRHGIAEELCALIPHAPVNNPLAGKPTTGELLSGYRYWDDYHDWACRNITPFYDRDFGDAIRYVGRLGAAGMIVNTLYGVGVFVTSMLAIGWVSGVPWRRFRTLLRQQRILVGVGLCLTLPIFLTGVDWVRWWVNIALSIGVVYLLYASTQPEVDAPPTRSSTRVFIALVVVLALIPVGIVPAFLAPLPI